MDKINDEFSFAKKTLAKDIIGEIVLSENPESVLKKWRSIFKISQKELAGELGVTSSVVSDYESGRRKSPGIKVIKKYIEAFMNIDTRKGGQTVRSFAKNARSQPLSSAIIDIKEFDRGIKGSELCRHLSAFPVVETDFDKPIYGYTVIDSLKAITELSFNELIKLYGITTQRALIFTKVSTGKTPMVAIKLTNLHPALVIIHGLDVVDDVAKRIAEVENIPLAVCRLESEERITEKLRELDY
jgi:putative transcriptional regulator